MKKVQSKSDWNDGFLFVGNQPVLDFVNTRPVQDGHAVELLTDFDALLRWFQAAGLLSSEEALRMERQWAGTARAAKTVEAMRDLRERLRTDLLTWEERGRIRQSAVEELNALLAEHPMRTRLRAAGRGHTKESWFEVREPEDLFAPLAQSAVNLFADADRKRVRTCANCVLHFHDTSKKGTRRWCSMQICGNRTKVAAYAARQRNRAER
jgi:predicted RNA-binding Zn ribbon-like protein